MERRKDEQIGNVIARYLRQSNLESPLNEYRLINAWGKVAGEKILHLTQDLHIYNQVLYVSLRSAVLRSELMMRRSQLVRQLNAEVGAEVIRDVVFK